MIEVQPKPLSEVVQFLSQVSREVPSAAVVLGSGVKVLEGMSDQSWYSYEQVFGISPTIVGHAGSLNLGRVDGRLVAVFRGRFHLYEGHDWDVVTLPTRALIEWGVPKLYLTNAAGGLNRDFKVGDLMLITGYRNHLHPDWRERGLVPALMAAPTDSTNSLTEHLWDVAERLSGTEKGFRPLRRGVYAALLGPSYETHAEIEMLRRLGCDAVGMSTAPELETARDSSMQAAAISVVTNVWKEDSDIEGHEEVLRAAQEASERLDALFRAAITFQP